MKTHSQALDTLFHGKAIRLWSVYYFNIYVRTSVSSDVNEGETLKPNICCLCPLLIKARALQKREEKHQLGVDFPFQFL